MLVIMTMCESDESRRFFIDLYLRYKRTMIGIAMKYVHDKSIAEDLVHDAIVKLIEKEELLTTFDGCTLTTYIVYTIRNVSISYLRWQQRDKQWIIDSDDEQETFSITDKSLLPEEVTLMNERIDEFGKVWMTLPEETRTLLAGKYILGLSDTELAEQYGCNPNSIRMKLTRARRQALKTFQVGGINFEPA